MKKDEQAAFPIQSDWVDCGMTLRDYFASAVLQSLIRGYDGTLHGSDPKIFTEEAYTFADEMLKERNKTKL